MDSMRSRMLRRPMPRRGSSCMASTSKPHFCKVYEWTGAFEMREQQSMAWQTLPVEVKPVLPGTVPVLHWFAQERGFEGTTHAA